MAETMPPAAAAAALADVGSRPQWSRPRKRGRCRTVDLYEKQHRIGQGTYGTVYRAVRKSDGGVVALKKVILHHEKSVPAHAAPAHMYRERARLGVHRA